MEDYRNFCCTLKNLSGCEFVILASVISIAISSGLNPCETDTLGNFFSALGSNLSTIASAEQINDC